MQPDKASRNSASAIGFCRDINGHLFDDCSAGLLDHLDAVDVFRHHAVANHAERLALLEGLAQLRGLELLCLVLLVARTAEPAERV
ncbi:hypothetical protein D3C72_1819200 [compost metagenome]